MINTKKAVALKYKSETDSAPIVLKKATRSLVDKMLELADKFNIVIYKDEMLAEALSAIPEGEEISPELYQAVAEVIAYCYSFSEKKTW
jgi:type III secretion system FlhB-like substrate exporter